MAVDFEPWSVLHASRKGMRSARVLFIFLDIHITATHRLATTSRRGVSRTAVMMCPATGCRPGPAPRKS